MLADRRFVAKNIVRVDVNLTVFLIIEGLTAFAAAATGLHLTLLNQLVIRKAPIDKARLLSRQVFAIGTGRIEFGDARALFDLVTGMGINNGRMCSGSRAVV